MSAAVAIELRGKVPPAKVRDARVTGPCPYCFRLLSIPRRYNAVDFCPIAKREAIGLPQRRPRFTLIDGHRVTTVDVQKTYRPRSGLWARFKAALGSAWAAWKATR